MVAILKPACKGLCDLFVLPHGLPSEGVPRKAEGPFLCLVYQSGVVHDRRDCSGGGPPCPHLREFSWGLIYSRVQHG